VTTARPSPPARPPSPGALEAAWPGLAASCGLRPGEPALLALSGGADSVALLHLARATQPLVACHVDHGLRPDSGADAEYCGRLCAELGVPFERVRVELAEGGDLERRAREARYGALARVAGARGLGALLVAHHADDADETLVQRWVRGTHPGGLVGPRPRAPFPLGRAAGPEVLRPLLGVRGAELRAWLRARGLAWREDPTNASWRFTRNRVRHGLLPLLERVAGRGARAELGALRAALAGLEDELERRAPRLALGSFATLGTPRVLRADAAGLTALAPDLARRALARAVLERTGGAPREAVLEAALAALAQPLDAAAIARRPGPGGGPLDGPLNRRARAAGDPGRSGRGRAELGLRGGHRLRLSRGHLELVAPGAGAPPPDAPLRPGDHDLGGGRGLRVELVRRPGEEPPRSALAVELRVPEGTAGLVLRAPRPGDRLHALGAPGSRPLRRVLADAGVPAEDRGRLALVARGEEVLWACGVRVAERRRVRREDASRLRLTLLRGPGADDFALPGR